MHNSAINESVRHRSEFNIESNYQDLMQNSSHLPSIRNDKIDKFYQQNLKVKAFYTLLRFAKKKKQIKKAMQQDDQKVDQYLVKKYFKNWRQAYSHKMNQLTNRKCFKVKFSDYCKCKKCLALQRSIDIKPEFDKFIVDPYPKISNAINSSREIFEDDSRLTIQSKSNHPFTKFFNPLERSYLRPEEDNSQNNINN